LGKLRCKEGNNELYFTANYSNGEQVDLGTGYQKINGIAKYEGKFLNL